MAQVISSSHLLQTKRAGFQCRYSPLNPAKRPIFSASMAQTIQPTLERTRTHITNLEKLLQLEAKPKQHIEPIEPKPKPELKANLKSNTSKERALLGGFNLAQIWSDAIQIQANEAAEISPRRLSRLQRLLSKKPEYSPRNLLGPRWREYHGSRDWAGLLDPLDENLRREVVRYGEFIQAAYQSFHSEPATTQDSINSRAEVNLLDKSYKVTKSLYATSSIGLPKWVDDVAPDLGWMTQRSSWVGYVAVCEDEREIARMGRRDIIIALRGTATCLEWAENFRIAQTPMENKSNSDSESDSGSTQKDQSKVECGFLSLLRTKGEHVPSLADSVVQEIKTLLEKYKGETLSITITGHSLGAALALLVADEVSSCAPEVPPVAVFSFGGPRVGNRPYANRIKNKNVKVLRIVNNQDLITKVPGMFMNEELEQKLMKNMAWAYSHVGSELRVDTKKSPYLKPDADVACCHDLEAYLHLVDGFIASNCPFRENAKRSLVKLLSEQGSNVKKLYMSKSKSFTLKLYTSRSKSFALRIERDGIVATTSDCMPSPSQS